MLALHFVCLQGARRDGSLILCHRLFNGEGARQRATHRHNILFDQPHSAHMCHPSVRHKNERLVIQEGRYFRALDLGSR